ncbi:hypothetical protein BASA60_000822, partial [Batrachochytrium salamandrivorans]
QLIAFPVVMTHSVVETAVGGIPVTVVRKSNSTAQHHAVLFLLHGRKEPLKRYIEHARVLVTAASTNTGTTSDDGKTLELVVVLFEQRNHGSRLVNAIGNDTWITGNPSHATDMWSIQYGTSKDVSFLIDVLQMHLPYLNICRWGMAGVSLGGHSTLLAVVHAALMDAFSLTTSEPRLDVAIAIIGCADYAAMILPRAVTSGLPIPPISYDHIPQSLLDTLKRLDPINNIKNLGHQKLLILSGGLDTMVPASANAVFVKLAREHYSQQGNQTYFDERIDPVAEHSFSPWMMTQTQTWIQQWLL